MATRIGRRDSIAVPIVSVTDHVTQWIDGFDQPIEFVISKLGGISILIGGSNAIATLIVVVVDFKTERINLLNYAVDVVDVKRAAVFGAVDSAVGSQWF